MQKGLTSTDRGPGSSRIRAVILDYGQVLAGRPTEEEFGRMAEMFNASYELFYGLWEGSRDAYDRGDLTAEEYWLQLAAQTNTSIKPEQIEILRRLEVEVWSHPIPGMLKWVSDLRAGGIKTGLLSNMPRDLVTHLRANCGWIENFAFKTFSAEVRLIKPTPEIYQHTLDGLGVAARETLFVDDREPNIQAARSLGIHGIQFRSIAQLKQDLEDFGFPILPAADSSGTSPANRAAAKIKVSVLPR
ncbi:MAG: HAD family phosphatase [Terriglobales bacterium]